MRALLTGLVSVFVVATVAFSGAMLVASSDSGSSLHLGGVWALTTTTSYNWAGYAATASTGQVTTVSGSWTEPAVTCGTGTSLAAFWVGIDGYSSSTVEQDGSLAQCAGGSASYYVWWETYPVNAVQTFGSIKAGDKITADVTFNSGSGAFTMKVNDTTSGKSWSKVSTNSGAVETSAECIAEAPAGASTSSGLYKLANFGAITFTTCKATIAGATGGIGTFSSAVKMTMVSYPSGTRNLAVPSALTSNTKFKVTWKHAS